VEQEEVLAGVAKAPETKGGRNARGRSGSDVGGSHNL